MTRFLSLAGARHRVQAHPKVFARLVAAGAYHRDRYGLFDPVSLEENHARALEIEQDVKDQIEAVKRDAARRLAALGASPSPTERSRP